MIYIQRVRSNDIGDDYGKQVELGKVFMSHHNWDAGEIPVTLNFQALSEDQRDLNGEKLKRPLRLEVMNEVVIELVLTVKNTQTKIEFAY